MSGIESSKYSYNFQADLAYYLLAHIKLENAADTYDEDYVAKMNECLGGSPRIFEAVVRYYNDNFDRLALANFIPLIANSFSELKNMLMTVYGITDEDREQFIVPFCNLLEEWKSPYEKYWEQLCETVSAERINVIEKFDAMADKFSSFFEFIEKATQMKTEIMLSHSLRKNGRAFMYNGKFIVMLPFPDENRSVEDAFMQLVHECTHPLTDSLLQGIRMDDGSHDIAEYQVILFDLWLFEKYDNANVKSYVEWISKEYLDAAEANLSDEQKEKLRTIFSQC